MESPEITPKKEESPQRRRSPEEPGEVKYAPKDYNIPEGERKRQKSIVERKVDGQTHRIEIWYEEIRSGDWQKLPGEKDLGIAEQEFKNAA
ncbi:MAG: hypothetical protein HYW89_04400 [Candidatus Sungiibacteriota bacterium]|uniref:Uncharacterized protein n=1 Tax=Candidatus Sungiibacteriota bacterium TaxID=2750080 RepID=A0A7T5RJF2_9BACT|nr:MAG: hypothetical protein HYW89_04400 [Candidatus Sungbacteria bacterium]